MIRAEFIKIDDVIIKLDELCAVTVKGNSGHIAYVLKNKTEIVTECYSHAEAENTISDIWEHITTGKNR